MNKALLYLVFRSYRGRLKSRLSRMKNPRYLVGAIFGAAYIWIFFGRRLSSGAIQLPEQFVVMIAPVGGSILLALFSIQWLLVLRDGGLNLTENEMDLLFPAPLSKRALLHYHYLKAQFGLLIASMVMVLFMRPVLGMSGYWLGVALVWLLFNALLFQQTALDFLSLGLVRSWAMRSVQLLLGLIFIMAAAANGFGTLIYKDQAAPLWLIVAQWVTTPLQWIARGFVGGTLQSAITAVFTLLAIMSLYYLITIAQDVSFEDSSLLKSKNGTEGGHVAAPNAAQLMRRNRENPVQLGCL